MQETEGQPEQICAKYNLIQKSFQDAKESLRSALNSAVNVSDNVELIIADGLYGLGKEDWDRPEDKWDVNTYKQLFTFCKVNNKLVIKQKD